MNSQARLGPNNKEDLSGLRIDRSSLTRVLIRKAVFESSLLWLACGITLFGFCWARVWIVCQFDLEKFQPLLEQFRMFEKYSPVPLQQLLTYSGSIGMTFNEPILILCIVVWGISRGSDVVSGELGRGTMEMLLGQPVGRSQLIITHGFVCTLGLLGLCFLAWLGIYCGIHTNSIRETASTTATFRLPIVPFDIPIGPAEVREMITPLSNRVSPNLFILPTLNLFGFGFFILALSSMLSSFDRYRWRTIGLVLGIYVIQFLLFLLSKATDWTGVVGYASFFSAYQPDAIVQFVKDYSDAVWLLLTPSSVTAAWWGHALAPLGLTSVLLGLGAGFYLVALWRFNHRDLPAPL